MEGSERSSTIVTPSRLSFPGAPPYPDVCDSTYTDPWLPGPSLRDLAFHRSTLLTHSFNTNPHALSSLVQRPPPGQVWNETVQSTVQTEGEDNEVAPPTLECPNLWAPQYIGIYLSYLIVGFVYGSSMALVYPFCVALDSESGNVCYALRGDLCMFWSLKIFIGFLTDTRPIFGYRRKPYLLLGWTIAACATAFLASWGRCHWDNNRSHDLQILLWCFWINNAGYVIADVAMDSQLIEYAQMEPAATRGKVQGNAYLIRSIGFLLADALTAFSFNSKEYSGDFDFSLTLEQFAWVLTAVQLAPMPFWIALKEQRLSFATRTPELFAPYEGAQVVDMSPTIVPTRGRRRTLQLVWDIMQNRFFGTLMCFIFVNNASNEVSVAARQVVNHEWVKMQPAVNALDLMSQDATTALGIFCCKQWFRDANWRLVLAFTTAFTVGLGILYWLVVWDICRSPWFAVSIDVDKSFAQGVSYLITIWAITEIAPVGLEGMTYALGTTMGNSGQNFGGYVTQLLNGFFDVQEPDIVKDTPEVRRNYVENSLCVMCCQIFYLIFMHWMPSQKEDAQMRRAMAGRSRRYAWVVAMILLVSVVWGSVTKILTVYYPCSPVLGGNCDDK